MAYSKSTIFKLLAKGILLFTVLAIVGGVVATPIAVYPVRAEGFTQSLNGEWSFQYIPALDAGADADFSKPDFDVSAWKKIRVPGNWELQGFAEPHYDLDLQDGLGLYRRTFRVPADWRGERRVCLRFEGVAYGFEVWVNGTKVGTSAASAYNPSTFDITDALKPDANADNVLAVQVTTKPFAYEFDVNDDWSLSGIYRDVTLFSVPATHVQDVTTRTKLAADGAAELSVAVTISQPDGEVHGKLLAPDGKMASEFNLPRGADGNCEAVVKVAQPQLWTAETPALYRLELTLSDKGQPLQTFKEHIGLREISIVDGVLKLNDRLIKLHGVDHHDMDPVDGRAITEAEMRRDLELMKKGNINFVRTSHYAPNQRFIELCDELGFYVMCEVAIGKGEEHMSDPAFSDNMLARTEATITRDKNHPSVIIWSIGNENPITDLLLAAGQRAKQLDPSRLICYPTIGSYFEKNYERFPEFVDIYSPHYPSNSTLRGYAQKLKRPLILTEYAHAWGLATDRIQDQWEILEKTPTFAGGAIWHFQDQGILRTAEKLLDPSKSAGSVWLDEHRYYDTHNADGCDGIVYSDRTPQADYWEVRKVYSPVQIAENSVTVKAGAQEIALTVENRYDFIALTGKKLSWSLQRNGAEIQKGETLLRATAHEIESVSIFLNIPTDAADDVLALELRCVDERGVQITERTVRLNSMYVTSSGALKQKIVERVPEVDLARARREALFDSLPTASRPKLTESEAEVKIEHANWVLIVSRSTGELTIHDRAGHLLVAGIYPHSGRKLTMAEERSVGRAGTWLSSTLTKLDAPEIKVTQEGPNVRLAVAGTYPHSKPREEKKPEKKTDDPLLNQESQQNQPQAIGNESFVGGYQAECAPSGAITISYDYAPTNAKGHFSEAGLSIVLPPELTEFRWIGQGVYPGYPGKDQLNEFGIFHLNREDLRFQGNRRKTELALLTASAGAGVAIITATDADVAVERDGDKTLLSHNAIISGLGNKGAPPETSIDADKTAHSAGSFTLIPFEDTWPAALTRWFGKPAAASEVFRPYYHSYDQ